MYCNSIRPLNIVTSVSFSVHSLIGSVHAYFLACYRRHRATYSISLCTKQTQNKWKATDNWNIWGPDLYKWSNKGVLKYIKPSSIVSFNHATRLLACRDGLQISWIQDLAWPSDGMFTDVFGYICMKAIKGIGCMVRSLTILLSQQRHVILLATTATIATRQHVRAIRQNKISTQLVWFS